MQHVLGNLNDSSYDEIMHENEMKRIMQLMNDDENTDHSDILCRKCMFAENM